MVAPVEVEVAQSDRVVPPAERAFEIYRLVEVGGLSTRAVAHQVGLSQTRVIQLRDSVESWVARQPSATHGLSKQQRLQAAEYKAGLRLDHLYSLALEAFRLSQGPEVLSEEAAGSARTLKTRISHGHTRYLQMAMRIAAQQSRIPATPMVGESDAACELPVAEVVEEPVSPPEEDCSPRSSQQSAASEAAREPKAATASAAATSAPAEAASNAASADFADDLFPVQTDLRIDQSDSLREPILTRKQRKRRARMLAALRNG